jgi:hypothetical protein
VLFTFDISVTIIEEDDSARFSFKTDEHRRNEYHLPENLNIFTDLQGNIKPFHLNAISDNVTDGLSDCFSNFIKQFDFSNASDLNMNHFKA